jgi:general secretion pathway protein B
MSYILEALRKSDQQRNRGASPTLLTTHAAPDGSSRPGYALYGLIAAMLIIGIAIGWWRPWHQETPAPAPAPLPPLAAPVTIPPLDVATVRAPEPERKIEPLQPVRLPAASVQPAMKQVTPAPAPVSAQLAATPSGITPNATPQASPPVGAAKAPVAATVMIAPSPAPQPAPSSPQQSPNTAPIATATLSYSELPFAIQQEIPRLTIAVHAYAKDPKNRLVTIDNRLLHEGDEVSPGLKMEQITPDGMIFNYKGYRFRRSVQEVVNNR